jgi:hypothetical protein
MPADAPAGDSAGVDSGLLAYFLFSLAAVFLGPLEAVLGLAVYWLFDSEEEGPQ